MDKSIYYFPGLWYHITSNPQKLSLCPMCMSSYLQKPIHMHALTCCKDMRHHKQPQRPRGWPGAFAFFKIFECIRTNSYTPPVSVPLSACPSRQCAARLRRSSGLDSRHQRYSAARAGAGRVLPYFAGDLCHQDFPGILCHQEFFPRRFVSIEWQPNQQYFAGDLCHQDFPGILCHQEFFPRRFVSIEWQPNRVHCGRKVLRSTL